MKLVSIFAAAFAAIALLAAAPGTPAKAETAAAADNFYSAMLAEKAAKEAALAARRAASLEFFQQEAAEKIFTSITPETVMEEIIKNYKEGKLPFITKRGEIVQFPEKKRGCFFGPYSAVNEAFNKAGFRSLQKELQQAHITAEYEVVACDEAGVGAYRWEMKFHFTGFE